MKVNCNQCGKEMDSSEACMAFNMGHGPVYLCCACKPPAKAEELKADLDDFMEACE